MLLEYRYKRPWDYQAEREREREREGGRVDTPCREKNAICSLLHTMRRKTINIVFIKFGPYFPWENTEIELQADHRIVLTDNV